jgi:hypothetical protein
MVMTHHAIQAAQREEWGRTCGVFSLRRRKEPAVTLLLGYARCDGAFNGMDIPVHTSQPNGIPA